MSARVRGIWGVGVSEGIGYDGSGKVCGELGAKEVLGRMLECI